MHTGSDYTARLNDPTPWTRRSIGGFLDTSRSLCRVAASFGTGQGGLLVTYRYDVAPGQEEAQRRLLAHQILPALADAPGVVGVHLGIADQRRLGDRDGGEEGSAEAADPQLGDPGGGRQRGARRCWPRATRRCRRHG